MNKFAYINSLDEIKSALIDRQEYSLYHLVDHVFLKFVALKGDFITVVNEDNQKQVFSLSHMYTKRALRPDEDIFKAVFLGEHDDTHKHQIGHKINNYEQLKSTLEAYNFDGFYTLVSFDDLVNNLSKGYFFAPLYKKNNSVDMQEVYIGKTTLHDGKIEFKDNIDNFVRLHYRPKDDLLVAFYNSFLRLNKAKVLVRFAFNLIQDEESKVYPLSNCGIDMIYDQHFYMLNLNSQTLPLYNFDRYDYVAQFASYDNHAHSTMVRTAEVLVFDRLSTKFIDQLIFDSPVERDLFLSRLENSARASYEKISIVDPTKFI